jgi:cell division protein FtsW
MNRALGILTCCVATLLALGAVMEFSIIAPKASTIQVGLRYLMKHALWMTLGVIAMLVMRGFDYRRLQKYALPIAVLAAVLLVIVLVPGIGTERNGARRWLRAGPVGFQPSEPAKIALMVALAALAAAKGGRMKEFRAGLLPTMGIIGAAVGLVILEPDFGTAALLGAIGLCMALAGGAPISPILAAGSCGAAGVGFLVWQSPARLARVFAFINPWAHQDGAGYQVIHSLLSLGSGGLFGRGLGAGVQKLYFLPEADTDFILAVIGEEFGLIGTLAVVVIFVILVRQGMRISVAAKDVFGGLLAFGITTVIALQALIHIAVVTASMPTKGITLPFVSSGGSSLVMTLAAVGILMNIGAQSEELPAPGKRAVSMIPEGA